MEMLEFVPKSKAMRLGEESCRKSGPVDNLSLSKLHYVAFLFVGQEETLMSVMFPADAVCTSFGCVIADGK